MTKAQQPIISAIKEIVLWIHLAMLSEGRVTGSWNRV